MIDVHKLPIPTENYHVMLMGHYENTSEQAHLRYYLKAERRLKNGSIDLSFIKWTKEPFRVLGIVFCGSDWAPISIHTDGWNMLITKGDSLSIATTLQRPPR